MAVVLLFNLKIGNEIPPFPRVTRFGFTKTTIDAVVLDASVSETHSADVEVTEHPVEIGAAVVDHLRVKPETVTLEGLISNTPLLAYPSTTQTVIPTGIRQGLFGLGGITQMLNLGGNYAPSATVNTSANAAVVGQSGRVESEFQKLRELKDSGRLCDIVTGLRSYKNMAMTSLSVPRSAAVGDALRFTATFREVRLVSALEVELQVTLNRAKKTKNDGPKPAKPAGKEATRAKTWAAGGADALSEASKSFQENFLGGVF